MQVFDVDLSGFEPVNHLWPQLVERLGADTSARAVRQALDLLGMRGGPGLMPALLVETCGVALVDRQQLRRVTGLPVSLEGDQLVLISRRANELQLLQWSAEPQ